MFDVLCDDILIAEDNRELRRFYQRRFQQAGYLVRNASDGQAALAMISQKVPSLLLLDIQMPRLNGFQVLEQFPKTSRPFPVILLSNFNDPHHRARAQQLGADGFLGKQDLTFKGLLDIEERVLWFRSI